MSEEIERYDGDSSPVEIALRTLASLLPGVGNLIATGWAEVSSAKREMRAAEFINGLAEIIARNDHRVNEEFVNKEGFADLFENAGRRVIYERTESKRNAYKNIVATGIVGKEVTYEDAEAQIRILDQIGDKHIQLLGAFYNPTQIIQEKGIVFQQGMITTWRKMFTQLLPDWEYGVLVETLTDIEDLKLVSIVSQQLMDMINHNVSDLPNLLTSRGKKFLSYIVK